ncbi:MAG TPA: 3-dehydroquinate synthase [Nevskiaceae bacterium]|nr:3-dehydroquinate synthase [Nevskiaceae bacterium]
METLTVQLGTRSYPIRIGNGLLADAANFAETHGRPLKIVSDAQVAAHYLPALLRTLKLDAADALVLPAGETQKTWNNAEHVLDWLLAARLPRDGMLAALGGGVIGDLAGFCAAIYQRGIDFVQIPTTLLAQVDSSVGGKTGVNHARGKNLIGAFHQPRAVVADLATLTTLPRRELSAGLAEVIKYGMLADALFFDWLDQNLDALLALEPRALAQAVRRCCELKAQIVGVDERESISGGPRALLNLGHTFGHAIETYTGYSSWLHGEAVGAGLCMAADLSARLGWISDSDAQRSRHLVARAGLPVRPPPGMRAQHFMELMKLDKKVAGGKLRLVLLRRLGDAMLSADYDATALAATLAAFSEA